MKRLALGLIAVVLAFGPATRFASAQPELDAAAVRFAAVDIYVDSTGPLAAWQFELTEATGAMAVVGVENGDSRAFPDAPHFDRAAVEQGRADRIIVADYSLASADQLPRGRTRVATVHVQLTGGRAPDFQLRLIAAGDPSGRPIAAEAVLELEDGSAQ